MSKIRALNEESSSSESEDETNRKLSKEAQEEQAKQKYNKALKTLVSGQKRDATELLEQLLSDPFLSAQHDDKQLTPLQQQLLMGCLKILGDLYREGEHKDLERAKLMLENAICIDSEDNINLWYRLGKISYDTGDLYLAHNAFAHALTLRPSHWTCLENIVTISYAIQDFLGCLHYCAAGLSKDPAFYKGLVFRDLVYNTFPELKSKASNEKIRDGHALRSDIKYGDVWRLKYLQELKTVRNRWQNRIEAVQAEIVKPKPKLTFQLQTLTLAEVMRNLVAEYERFRDTPAFHETAEMSWSVQDMPLKEDLSKPSLISEDSSQPQVEEDSQTLPRRSRSSSDDKENNSAFPSQSDCGSQQDLNQSAEDNSEKRLEGSQENSQPLEGPGAAGDGDAGGRKKNKRDVKWWQMEGKRRSQRVRGHLMPTFPDKAKKESSFSDQLKNLIPAPLLGDDGSSCERDVVKLPEKSPCQKGLNINYFGTKEEESHVKLLLASLNYKSLPVMLTYAVHFLVAKVKYPWPASLRELFITSYKYYRSHSVSIPILSMDPSKLLTDAFACVTFLELFVEKHRLDLNLREPCVLSLFNKEILHLDESISLHPNPPCDLTLRMHWLSVRRLLQMPQRSTEEHINLEICSLLSQMEMELRKEPLTILTPNETMNLICLESVTEKASSLAKMKNSQVITELFQGGQYESLIAILHSCINFAEIEKRDLSDLYYYTVALFKTGSIDCIHNCLNLLNHLVRLQDTTYLSDSLLLLEEIWEQQQKQFTLTLKRSAVGTLIKILVSCEIKPPTQEAVFTTPWCLLHSILYSCERSEPAFYLEEDTVPNSVLLLQMAHECMSRAEKCCINGGKLLLHTTKAILEVKKLDEYMAYEETRHCMEQAIFCLYSYPNKKSKIKYLKEHNSSGIKLSWPMCPVLYLWYCPEEIPEFDSYGSISGDVEALYHRLLDIMPKDLAPSSRQKLIEESIKTCDDLEQMETTDSTFPQGLRDIYYLLGDYYFKNKEWSKSVQFYTWDLAVSLDRFDSWAAIALSLGENINTTLNTADEIDFRDLLKKAKSTAHCFNNALKLDVLNMKLRIEFGSFVYAMHAYCSRLMKQDATSLDMGLFKIIERSQQDFIKSAFKCFEPIAKSALDSNDSEVMEDEMWIHHYMLGKIYEKIKEDADQFLKQYEIAGKLLHEQGAPYPIKMNYYSPPELAIEALEIYYRIHASILNLVETHDYSTTLEKVLVHYIRRQENSPFVRSKQSRGDGDSGKRGRKIVEDTVSKKDLAEIASLVKEMLDKTEKLVESKSNSSNNSSSSSGSSSSDDSSTDSVAVPNDPSPHQMNSYSLSEFRKRLQEREQRDEEAIKAKSHVPETPKPEEDLYEGLDLENNRFYPVFKDIKYGSVVSLCLKAMEECISRYPYHYKAYFRLAQAYIVFLKDANAAKEYLMGSLRLAQRKINGLFGERKANNFFNGIWRNPIDDIDRPGSFSYHMNKTMQLLINVLSRLNDHSLLAEIVLLLAKVPDNEKKYLSNPDREVFCQQAFNACMASAKRRCQEAGTNYHDAGLEIYETYVKLQKHNPRQNSLPNVLHDAYKMHCRSQNVSDEGIAVDHAIKYFSFHSLAIKSSLNRAAPKGSSQNSTDGTRPAEFAGTRKRGRRATRQPSQEAVQQQQLPTPIEFDNASLYSTVASLFQRSSAMMPVVTSSSSSSSAYRLPPMLPSPFTSPGVGGLAMPKKAKLMEPHNRNLSPPPAHAQKSTCIQVIDIDTPPTKSTEDIQPVSFAMDESQRPGPSGSTTFLPGKNIQKGEKAKAPPSRPSVSPNPSPSPTSGSSARPPEIPSAQPIRINTSPYKAQTTAVEQPPDFSYSKQKNPKSSGNGSRGGRRTPPVAHSNLSKKRLIQEDEDEAEVIDLTVKTPEKEKVEPVRPECPFVIVKTFAQRLSKSDAMEVQRSVESKSVVQPQRTSPPIGKMQRPPARKKLVVEMPRPPLPLPVLFDTPRITSSMPVVEAPRASVPKPVPVETTRASVPKPVAAETPRSSVLKPVAAETPRASVPKPVAAETPRSSVLKPVAAETPRASVPKPVAAETPRASVPKPVAVETPRASVPKPVVADTYRQPPPKPKLLPAPSREREPLPKPSMPYPLPPKKKHHFTLFRDPEPITLPTLPPPRPIPPSNPLQDEDDIEVIEID